MIFLAFYGVSVEHIRMQLTFWNFENGIEKFSKNALRKIRFYFYFLVFPKIMQKTALFHELFVVFY